MWHAKMLLGFALLLAGCGQSPNALAADGVDTRAEIASADSAKAIESAVFTPRATNGDSAGSARGVAAGNLSSTMVGRWSRDSGCADSMELRADGSFSLTFQAVHPEVRWSMRGNELVLRAPGVEDVSLGFVVMGNDRFEMTHPRTGRKGIMVRCSS